MKRLASVALVASALVGYGVVAAPAQATASNVGGWTSGTITCSNNAVSVFPVIVANASAVTRTGSYTVPYAISDAVQVASSPNGISCSIGSNYKSFGSNFTVPSGGATVMWVGLGMSTSNNTGWRSHNIGFGGLPSGTENASWYDLGLTLNNSTDLISGGNTFSNLTATYQSTGGIDLATSGQDGFVLTNCVTTADGSILPGSSILTPYNNGQWTSGPSYSANQPICAAWMPEGTFTAFTNAGSATFTVQAAQTYGLGGTSVAMAGSATATITSASISINGGAAVTVPVNVPSGGAWVGQDPATQQWFLANATATAGQSVALTLNGQAVGTVTI